MNTIFENQWVIALITGFIVTIVGGIVLNKILKDKKSKKQSFELINDGELKVDKELLVGDFHGNPSSQTREHKVKLGEESKTVVKENFIIGNKKQK